jgi:hypothetical protein
MPIMNSNNMASAIVISIMFPLGFIGFLPSELTDIDLVSQPVRLFE